MTTHILLTSLFLVSQLRIADTHYVLAGKCRFLSASLYVSKRGAY